MSLPVASADARHADEPGRMPPRRSSEVLRLVIGQPRFSDRHGWDGLAAHWPDDVAARVEVEALPAGALAQHLIDGRSRPDVVVPLMSPLPAAAIGASGFGLVQQFGSGTEAIDLTAATRSGVWVANMAGLNAAPVAEHAVTLLLALLHRLPEAGAGFRQGHWGEPAGRSLAASTVAVIGLGAVGTAVAERLVSWGAAVVGVHRGPAPPSPAQRLCSLTVSSDDAGAFREVLGGVDAVVVAASDQRGRGPVIDASALAALRPGAHLVNVARAGLVDHGALLAALDSGHLASAALDVFPAEPCADDDPLVSHSRVLATAHTAALTSDFFAAAAARLGLALRAFLEGQPPTDLLNPGVERPRARRGR